MNNSKKANIICILTDDQGIWAAGCYGNPEIKTPNIDKFATTGIKFNNFFCTTPVCSPSRATLLTGRIPSQHGIYDWISGGNVGVRGKRYLDGETCYTDIMARNGWTCGIVGKWHLGDSQIPQHGFTDWYVHQRGGGGYYNADMVRDGQLITENGYITDIITDEAIKLINKYVKNNYPFYLSVHYTAPHSPYNKGQHPKDIVEFYDNCKFETCPQESRHPWTAEKGDTEWGLGSREMLKGYFASVTAMDKNVGRILDVLEKLKIKDNTLVVFLSDNGYSCGHHGFWGKGGDTDPPNMYEYSIKVPFIISHPGKIPKNKVENTMVSGYDFMPTLLDYIGLPIPSNLNMPGKSFVPILKWKNIKQNNNIFIYTEYGSVRMIRTDEWKYVYRHASGPDDLYNLKKDPDERENLIDERKHKNLIKRLKTKMDKWFEEYVIPGKNGLLQKITVWGQNKKI